MILIKWKKILLIFRGFFEIILIFKSTIFRKELFFFLEYSEY